MNIAALLTCHNRREKTLACLRNLYDQQGLAQPIKVFLVADGCTDGTVEAVRSVFPQATVIEGDGTLFWNRGMRLAFEVAITHRFDFYLWINDDTMIHLDAVMRLLNCTRTASDCGRAGIVVGSIADPKTGALTYGGVIRPKPWKRTHFQRVRPDATRPVECETMNGNLVLIPRAVVDEIGNLDAVFPHAMGDFDYGLRARKSGFGVWVAPGFYGTCGRNPTRGSFEDRSLPLHKRWASLTSVKALPIPAWRHFTRRHAKPIWPVFWLWPYARVVLSSALRRNPEA